MPNSNEYRRQVMNDLAEGNVESLDSSSEPAHQYDNFDDFAQRSSRSERKQLFGRAFHPNRVPSSQMEPELQKAIAQIKPNERDDVAKEFLNHLKKRNLSDRDLEKQLGLSTHHASRMNADDVAKLAGFTYHNHPDIFQEVMADQPAILKFLSNPLVGAALGAVAAKWFGRR
ncbi:MAG: hypothetical protein HC873_08945 [Leptolyngbyaceae cyanobacterium SL_1_1]|nr:hypothetical protein [Leptolyngbyaceae cyanobacterium RM2_2_21]NJN03086.1 hypothetical protein [Leptolyngbyaceae cyanobacterium RM1_1_2]NJO09751.1 hypothetical protein [Leptolyngbyaceae cyanobacterium SL_1_1]